MIDIKYLRLIETVASEGSLSGAAKKLFLTQSALSHQLKEVEQQMGTEAFHRVNKKLVMTPAGNIVLAAAKRILPLVEDVDLELKKYTSGEIGQLRLCTECYTCYHWLPTILKKFSSAFPNVDIQIITENINEPLKLVRTGKVDLALVHRPEKDNTIDYVELFKDELVLIVSSRHPLAQESTITAKHFADQVLITHSAKGERSLIFQEMIIPAGVEVRKIIYVQLTEAVIEMVKAGIGIAVLPKWTLRPYLENNNLSMKKINNKGLIRKWFAATLKSSKKNNHIEFFTQLLKNEVPI
jgi:LysR family transcriptional regulator for metE and metH